MNTDVFNGKAQFYKARPTYPDECIDFLISTFNLNENSVIADIGAGTGILSVPFLERGMTVLSVEPNADMFNELKNNLSKYEKSFCYNTTAEVTTLNDKSCDLIVVGSALHWFDIERFRVECERICDLKKVVILQIHNYFESNKKSLNMPEYADPCVKATKEFFGNLKIEEKRFEYELDYDQDRFINEYFSMGYAPLPKDEIFEITKEKLSKQYKKYYGENSAKFPFLAQCFMTK